MIDLDQITGFDWDDGNRRKNADKHDVSQAEAESIFFNDPLIVVEDAKHSEAERRFNALGKTNPKPLAACDLHPAAKCNHDPGDIGARHAPKREKSL
jgi:uncharacterized DUF497 family protein